MIIMAESFSQCLIVVTLNLKGFRKAFYACTILKLVSSSFEMQMFIVLRTFDKKTNNCSNPSTQPMWVRVNIKCS